MEAILFAAVSVTVIGALCAAILSAASKALTIAEDEEVAALAEFLPGSNCGACGYPGCSGYAKALIKDPAVRKNLCIPGGPEVAAVLGKKFGVEAGEVAKKTAVVHCAHTAAGRPKKMDYKGIQTCEAAHAVFGGEGACAFGCLGYGDCMRACPSGAICVKGELAKVVGGKCTGCGMCLQSCPKGLFSIIDGNAKVAVLCSNTEKGAVVRKKCSAGCLGCGRCARECPEGAIVIKDNLAVIDYARCTGCGKCADVCVGKCIKRI